MVDKGYCNLIEGYNADSARLILLHLSLVYDTLCRLITNCIASSDHLDYLSSNRYLSKRISVS